jgi:tagatose 1,6-diphosphate aldolase
MLLTGSASRWYSQECGTSATNTMTKGKLQRLQAASNQDGVIAALAMDQRRSLQKLIAGERGVALEAVTDEDLSAFKAAVSRVLTPYASAILLDTNYGLQGMKQRADGCGLLVTYESDGFENPRPHKMLQLDPALSVRRIAEIGGQGVKILLTYTPFDDPEWNDRKHAMVERIGYECDAAEVPFYLEFVGYDYQGGDENSVAFAQRRPEIVIRSMEEFSKPIYRVDIMKVQFPVSIAFVEGTRAFQGQRAQTRQEALDIFRRASSVARKPFVYLSAGVTNQQFTEYLEMGAESGTEYSGVLCGRATWKDGVPAFAQGGVPALEDWLADGGVKNIQAINERLTGAKPWRKMSQAEA